MMLRGWVLLGVMGWGVHAQAQQPAGGEPKGGEPKMDAGPAAQLQLSPQAAYNQSVQPLNLVREATANWSDAEKNALGVAILQASRECQARDAKTYTGDDLIAYLQLCNFGWQWNAVQSGAWLYINAKHRVGDDESVWTTPGLGQAYAYEIKASLNLKDAEEAYFCAEALLKETPYTPLAEGATTATIRYLQMLQPRQAQGLARHRYDVVLAELRRRSPEGTVPGPASAAVLQVHELYGDALEWAAMMQFDGIAGDGDAVKALEAALPAKLSADETILTGEARRRYALLGTPLPKMAITANLGDAKLAAPAELGRSGGAGMVLLVFPDWCSHCVGMGTQFAGAAARVGKKGLQFYAVLAQDGAAPAVPAPVPVKAASAAKGGAAKAGAARSKGVAPERLPGKAEPDPEQVLKPKTPADMLLGTPTLMVPKAAIEALAAETYPWLIVTDGQGVVRFEQAAPVNVLEAGSLADQLADHVLLRWPVGEAGSK